MIVAETFMKSVLSKMFLRLCAHTTFIAEAKSRVCGGQQAIIDDVARCKHMVKQRLWPGLFDQLAFCVERNIWKQSHKFVTEHFLGTVIYIFILVLINSVSVISMTSGD